MYNIKQETTKTSTWEIVVVLGVLRWSPINSTVSTRGRAQRRATPWSDQNSAVNPILSQSFIKIEAGNFHYCTVFVYWDIPSIFISLTCTLKFKADFRKNNDADWLSVWLEELIRDFWYKGWKNSTTLYKYSTHSRADRGRIYCARQSAKQ